MPVTVTVLLAEADMAALDHYIESHRPGQSREKTVTEIVAQWLKAHPSGGDAPPDEGLRPDELNASNDS